MPQGFGHALRSALTSLFGQPPQLGQADPTMVEPLASRAQPAVVLAASSAALRLTA